MSSRILELYLDRLSVDFKASKPHASLFEGDDGLTLIDAGCRSNGVLAESKKSKA